MKSTLLCSLAALAVSGMGYAQESTLPVVDTPPVEKIFVPDGFDSNDEVEVILHGKFPSTCYKIGETTTLVDEESKTIKVNATSYYYPDVFCIQSITPFIQVAEVGRLQAGDYKVVFEQDEMVSRKFDVEQKTTESPDDFLYAPVENAFIDIDPESGKQALKLQGRFPFLFIGCMVMKEVRAYQAPEDVLVVQPIAEIIDGPECETQPSDRSFNLTKGLEKPFFGEGLLHIRTLNGSSLNRFIDIQQ